VEVSSGNNKPYEDYLLMNGDKLRAFSEDASASEYVWHRDKEDRIVYVEQCGDLWFFQEDNKEPVELKKGDRFNIERMKYHRLIKGDGKLILRIKEL
jgi:hypothetical protein